MSNLITTNKNSKLALNKSKRLLDITNTLLVKKQDLLKSQDLETVIKDKYGNIYKEVISPYTGKIWLDRNLGASRVAIAIDDEESYGDYFQWGRDADGHEKKDSDTIEIASKSETPNHNKFILTGYERWDWHKEHNEMLWQGVNGKNNPCPKGYRVPTIQELLEETVNQGVKTKEDAFENFLKLPSNSLRAGHTIFGRGGMCALWSSNISSEYKSFNILFNSGKFNIIQERYRTEGIAIRCIKD